MSLETATYIDALVTSNPDGTDARTTADDHLRLIKAATKRTFPLIAGAVSASHAALSFVNDLSASVQAQLNTLRDGSATVFYALGSNLAQSASFAINAGFAQSASYAAHAGEAVSASFAQSASFATNAGFAQSASFATLAGTASNALSLGGIAAAGYAALAVPQTFTKGQTVQQLDSSGTSLTPSCDASNMFRHILTGTTTINLPTAARSGMVITLHLVQDGTGGRTATWHSVYKFAGGTTPTLSTGSGNIDVFAFQYDATSAQWRQAGLNVS